MSWVSTADGLIEFFVILIFCMFPAIWIVYNINNIICGVL